MSSLLGRNPLEVPRTAAPMELDVLTRTANRRALLLGLVVSLIGHAALLSLYFQGPLAHVRIEGPSERIELYRVERAPLDQVLPDDLPMTALIGGGTTALGGNAAIGTTGALQPAAVGASRELLRGDPLLPAGPRNDDPRAIAGLGPRDAPPSLSQRPGNPLQHATPRIDLPESLALKTIASNLDIPYVPGGDGSPHPVVGAEGRGGSGVVAAQGLLGRDPPAGPGRAAPAPPDVPRVTEPTPMADIGAPRPSAALDLTALLPIEPIEWQRSEHLDDDFDYVVTLYQPAGRQADPEGYYRVDIIPKRSLRKLRTIPKDLVVMIDTSGSISPAWVRETIDGVRDALGTLNPGDRFNIVRFKDTVEFLSVDGSLPADEANLAAAEQFITGARSGGTTDVNRALSRLLVRDVAVDRVYSVLFISDGVPTRGVLDTREVLNLITRDNDLALSIYCVGIGDRQNRELLEFLAYRNKGRSVIVDHPRHAAAAIRDLASRLRYPIMKDLRLTVAGLPLEPVYPKDLPNIHQGETLSVFGRGSAPAEFTMSLAGHNGQQALDFTFRRNLEDALRGGPDVARGWAFLKLHQLYTDLQRRGDNPQTRADIEHLRRQYGLKTLY